MISAVFGTFPTHQSCAWVLIHCLGLIQEEPVGWDPISLWKQMGVLAKIVVGILFIMSGWSIGVMIDRAMAFSAARKDRKSVV